MPTKTIPSEEEKREMGRVWMPLFGPLYLRIRGNDGELVQIYRILCLNGKWPKINW